jgi:hypothetical protein
MHAYASTDPVFLAMNQRGQEETDGALGSFCVNCHAPLAVREGATDDGLNLDEVDPALQGVTCYFCHNVESIDGEHNNPAVLRGDATVLGSLDAPAESEAHASAYAPHLDARDEASAELCGACHDVTLTGDFAAAELDLERTFAEWKSSLFARPVSEGGLTCAACHMPASPRRKRSAEIDGAPLRLSRRHDFEGVDLAITPFPGRERQRVLVERALGSTLLAEICVSELGSIEVTLENAGAGHNFPSGASHDRRAWLELAAFTADAEEPVLRTGDPEASDGAGAPAVVMKDTVLDADGDPAHMFWDVAELVASSTLPGVATRDPLDPEFHRERRIFRFQAEGTSPGAIERVTLRVRIRPIALEILEDLVESGHLDAELVEAMPVIDLLPDRCYDAETVESFPDILAAPPAGCADDADRAFTLVYERSEAVPENPKFRQISLEGVPARCLSHPSYVAVPATPAGAP